MQLLPRINENYTSTKTWTVDTDIETLVYGYIHEKERELSLNITIYLIQIILHFTQTDWIMKNEDGTRICTYGGWNCIKNIYNKFQWKPILKITTGRNVSFGRRIQIFEPFDTKCFITVQFRYEIDRIHFYIKAPNGDDIFQIKINNYVHLRHIAVGNEFVDIQTATKHIKQKDMIKFVVDLQQRKINMIVITDSKEYNTFQLPKKNGDSWQFGFEFGQFLNIVNYGYL